MIEWIIIGLIPGFLASTFILYNRDKVQIIEIKVSDDGHI